MAIFAIELPEIEVDNSLKDWTVVFNQDLDESTLTEDKIYLMSPNMPNVEFKIDFDLEKDKQSILIRPIRKYNVGEKYYLYLDKDIRSLIGETLTESL